MRARAFEANGITKRFGDLVAVDSLDLSVDEGTTFGLLGPNGCGKTTLIKMLCGITAPTSGTATVLGRPAGDKGAMARVGYMPQETAVYMDNTVHENLQLFAGIYGMSGDALARREREILKFVDLSARRDELAGNLSGGMKHRLSLACALVHEPRLLFLDEPTVGVDPELRSAFWDYFNQMGKKGVTVVITTHYMDEASHCGRVALMRQGRLIAQGTPESLKAKTKTGSLEDAFLALARRDRR